MADYIRFEAVDDDADVEALVRRLWSTTAAVPHSARHPTTVIVDDEDEEAVLAEAERIGLKVHGRGVVQS